MISLRTVPVDRLKPAPYNPRIPLEPDSPAYRRLERSLDEFDLVQPVVWNERTGHVVSGHQRLRILRDRGLREIEVAVVDLPLEREKALNVTLNNDQVGSDWDPDKLLDLLGELRDLPDFDATLTGFDDADLRNLLLAPNDDLVPDEIAPTSDDRVRVQIEVAAERWEHLRPEIDRLAAEHDLTLHVHLPS